MELNVNSLHKSLIVTCVHCVLCVYVCAASFLQLLEIYLWKLDRENKTSGHSNPYFNPSS